MFLTIFLITSFLCIAYFFFQHSNVKKLYSSYKNFNISRYMFVAGWLLHFAILLLFIPFVLWLYNDLFFGINTISSILIFFLLFILIPTSFFKDSLLFVNKEKKIKKLFAMDNNSNFVKNNKLFFFKYNIFLLIIVFLIISIAGYYLLSNQLQHYAYIMLLLVLLFLIISSHFLHNIEKKQLIAGCIHSHELENLLNNLIATMNQKDTPCISWNNSKEAIIKNNLNEYISINFLNPVKFSVCDIDDIPKLSNDYTLFKVRFSSYLNNDDKIYNLISPYNKRLTIASLINYSSNKLIVAFLYYITVILFFPFVIENHIVISRLLVFAFFLLAGLSIVFFVFFLFLQKKNLMLFRRSNKVSFFEYNFFEKFLVVLFLVKIPK